MSVAVMQIGIVRMTVYQGRVTMPVRMRLSGRIIRTMLVPVMLVVHMSVLVLHSFVRVFVGMTLCQMQIDANGHQQTRNQKAHCDWLTEHGNSERRADKGSR
jgi:hypothetical protein